MTQENFAKAIMLNEQIDQFNKALQRLKYKGTVVSIESAGVSSCVRFEDRELNRVISDYMTARITKLKKEFEEL